MKAPATLRTTHEVRWCSSTYDALGHVFAVRCPDHEMRDWVEVVFAEMVVAGGGEHCYDIVQTGTRDGGQYAIYFDRCRVYDQVTRDVAMGLLVWHVNGQVGSRHAPGRLLLHAGAVARGSDGIALPAPMESGKSTTVAGLVQAGFSYLSDEVAAIEVCSGRMHAYPRALSIDQGSWPVLPNLEPAGSRHVICNQWQVPPSAIRAGVVATEAATVRCVVFPSYRPESSTALCPVGPAEATKLLALSAFGLTVRPAEVLQQAAAVAARCRCFRLTMSDLDAAVRCIESVLAEPAEAPPK